MTDARLATLGVEVAAQADAAVRAATVGVEALVAASGVSWRTATVAIEVLVPNVVVDASYAGWGIKL
jgi:hypothetical protein